MPRFELESIGTLVLGIFGLEPPPASRRWGRRMSWTRRDYTQKKIRKQTKLSACKNGFPFPVHREKFSPLA